MFMENIISNSDLYAVCEYYFGHIENPKGLLDDHEVYCKMFPKNDKLDCLEALIYIRNMQ